jgi:hypothetical protein
MTGLRGFGMTIEGGTVRKWYAGEDGVRRWADNDQPVDISTPEAPMNIDLGHPLQNHDEPKPFDAPTFTPQEQDNIVNFKLELERQRRVRNKLEADRDIAKLGVVFTDDGPEAA